MLCVLMKILSHASAKEKAKRLKGFRFCTFIGVFFFFFLSDIMTVNGLDTNVGLSLELSRLPAVGFRNKHYTLLLYLRVGGTSGRNLVFTPRSSHSDKTKMRDSVCSKMNIG